MEYNGHCVFGIMLLTTDYELQDENIFICKSLFENKFWSCYKPPPTSHLSFMWVEFVST